MNKRKAKKHRKKTEAFVNSFASSYKELRKLDRDYREYVVFQKRKEKQCYGCEFYLEKQHVCIKVFVLEPCIKDLKK